MSLSTKLLFIVGTTIACSIPFSVSAENDARDNIIGRTIFMDLGGNSSGGAYVSLGVVEKGRNLVELHFGMMTVSWHSPSRTLFNEERKVTDTFSIMVNCKLKKYSPYPTGDISRVSEKYYYAGSDYDWTDFSSGDVIMDNKDSMKEMHKLFGDACASTDI